MEDGVHGHVGHAVIYAVLEKGVVPEHVTILHLLVEEMIVMVQVLKNSFAPISIVVRSYINFCS